VDLKEVEEEGRVLDEKTDFYWFDYLEIKAMIVRKSIKHCDHSVATFLG